METNPGPSSANNESVIYSAGDYGIETHNLLRKIVQGIHDELSEPDKALDPKCYLERASKFTGFHPETLKKISETDAFFYLCHEIDRKKIHEQILTYCIKNKCYPTPVHLFFVLREHLPPYVDNQSFLKLLINMGYIFKKKARTSAPGIAERTEITCERYLYLKNITLCRRSSQNIFFIGEASASLEGRVFNIIQTEAYGKKKTLVPFMYIISVKSGLISLHIVDEFNEFNFQSWIIKDIIPKLPQHGVVVLDNSKHHNAQFCQPPEINSVKAEITEWLEYYDVPHSKSMSKTQLWGLVEKYTDVEANVYVIDNMLKEHGHEVLRLPDCINDLSLATGGRHLIKSVMQEGTKDIKSLKAILNSVVSKFDNKIVHKLKTYNSNLIKEEISLMKLDEMYEDVKDEMEMSNRFYNPDDLFTPVDTEMPYFTDSE